MRETTILLMTCGSMKRMFGSVLLVFLVTSRLSVAFEVSYLPDEPKSPYDPPVMNFQKGISLLDAVRLTLRHDPNIKLSEATVNFQKGVAQEQEGLFDWTLSGNFSYEHRQQELRESMKEVEQEKRDSIDDGIAAGEQFEGEAKSLLSALREARSAAPGDEKIKAIPDPIIQAQLLVIDALINEQTESGVREQLLKLRQKVINDNIDVMTEGLSTGLEDLTAARLLRKQLGEVPDDEVFKTMNFGMKLDRLLRNGILISPFFKGKMEGDNYKGKPKDEDFGGKGIENLYQMKVGFDVTVPLLRGRGTESASAGERAAIIEHEASRFSLNHQSSQSVLDTVTSYWNLRLAQDSVSENIRSTERHAQIVQLTQLLIEADELPAVDLARSQAGQARAKARLEIAEQQLHQARVALAVVMGLSVTDDETTLPLASDDFVARSDDVLNESVIDVLVRNAMLHRQDLLASVKLQEADQVLEVASEIDLRPKLDLLGSGWMTGLGERSIKAAGDRWVGPSVSLGFNFERPFGNNFFEGRYAQNQAARLQSEINSANLKRKIRLAIVRTARSLMESSEAVRHSQRSVEFYNNTVEAEIQKFQAGDSTLIDTILTEDQKTASLLSLIAAQQEFASLVAELRFQAGVLVSHQAEESVVTSESLTAIPSGR